MLRSQPTLTSNINHPDIHLCVYSTTDNASSFVNPAV